MQLGIWDSPIRLQFKKMAIPEALKGNDIIGQAQTGSGKTIAFAIPILEKIFVPDKSPQAIVLCPTRELCMQVASEISKVGSKIKKLKVLAVYGGQPIGKQTRVLKREFILLSELLDVSSTILKGAILI